MKKLLTAGVALLSVATLAACSGKTASESSSKDAKASSSKVENHLLQKANQAVHQNHLNQQPLLLKFQKLSC